MCVVTLFSIKVYTIKVNSFDMEFKGMIRTKSSVRVGDQNSSKGLR